MRSRAGLTLIEVLIAAGLGLLLLGLLHQFLVPIMQTSARVSTRGHLAEQAHYALTRLSSDLRQSTAAALSHIPADGTSNSTLAVCRRDGITASGRDRFEANAIIYFVDPEEKELRRRVWPPGPPALPITPNANSRTVFEPDQLLKFLQSSMTGKLLATGVKEFEALDKWPPEPVVTSRLLLEKNVPGHKNARVELLKRSVFRH